MPLGEAIAEILFSGVADVLVPAVMAFLRFPGALIGWAIGQGRTWKQVWAIGDAFGQALLGFFVHLAWISCMAASCP